MIDFILQAAAVGLLVLGLWLSGNKDARGPLLAAIAELLWIAVGIMHSVWGLVALSAVLAVVQARAFILWKGDKP